MEEREEWVEIARELTLGVLQRLGIETEIEGSIREGEAHIEIKSDEGGILIGKHGRTLDSLQVLINRMVNKRIKRPIRIILDVGGYKHRRAESLKKMAVRLGENAKKTGKAVTIGAFNAHDRRIIHLSLREDLSLKTESLGEGDWKKIKIIPVKQEGNNI
jgi:spoIIIJ-associated protein